MKKLALCLCIAFSCNAHVNDLVKSDGQAYWDNCRALGFKAAEIRAACLAAAGNLISSSATAIAFRYEVDPTDYIRHYHIDTITAWDMHAKILRYLAAYPYNKQGSLSMVAMDVIYLNYNVKWRKH